MFRDKDKEGKHNICGVNKYTDEMRSVVYGHNGDNGLSEASLKFNPKTGESFFYGAVGETLTYKVAYETLKKSDIEKPELGEILSRRDELKEAGFDFKKMKSMVDKKNSFEGIAKEADKALEIAKSKKSSGREGVSDISPSSSPRAGEQPPLRVSLPPSPRK